MELRTALQAVGDFLRCHGALIPGGPLSPPETLELAAAVAACPGESEFARRARKNAVQQTLARLEARRVRAGLALYAAVHSPA